MSAAPAHFDLDQPAAYAAWRAHKLARYPRSAEALLIEIQDPGRLSAAERAAIVERCERANMAIYVTPPRRVMDAAEEKETARRIGRQLGLRTLDVNYLADDDGVSALTCVEGGVRGDFIPYTNRAIRWHTDGYYNPPERSVRAMVLHCVQRAEDGGANRLLDHELVYLQLRDANPEFIRALMAPDVLTIPARNDEGGEARADQTGSVFSFDPDGHLHMRYTARTRSIAWKSDRATQAAVAALEQLLAANPYVLAARLEPGMGLICNNVLHDRSAFTDSAQHRRLILRARYYERIGTAAQPERSDPDRCAAAAQI